MPKTTVVNIKDHPDWKKKGYVYIGRSTIFGNPFRITKKLTRARVIALYRTHFWKTIEPMSAGSGYDPKFRKAVHALKGKTLVCHCVPKACHGNVIADYLNKRGEI